MNLSDLSRMSTSELDALYRDAHTPSEEEFEGEYDGLLLTGQFPRVVGMFSIGAINQPWLPWKGKVFRKEQGKFVGANRFVVAGRKKEIWPFLTRVVPSRFGGEPAILIDYDIPGSPIWLRKGFFDELKKLEDGLYLGKGGMSIAGHERFVFIWALAPA